MESIENMRVERELLMPYKRDEKSNDQEVIKYLPALRRELAAQGLRKLWSELELTDEPLIFTSPSQGVVQSEYHPFLLDRLINQTKRRKRPTKDQLLSWKHLDPPAIALGISGTREVDTLLKADLLWRADIKDRRTVPSSPYGWMSYTFSGGWKAIAVIFYMNDDGDSASLVAIPPGRQDEWLMFLNALDGIREAIARKERHGRVEIIGGDDDLADVIKKASFQDVVLNEDTLNQVAAQRRIFDPKMLERYASLHVPRLRKVLMIGPPGTGKTTLLKAEGAYHAQQGGLVFYVCAPPRNRMTSSWQQLAVALHSGAESRLPTLVLVEDFEMFVSDPQELQLILNTLDGVATPDNPAGTLLLATSNDPEKIDQRIRDRPGRIDMLIEIGLVEDLELAIRFLKHFLGTAYHEELHVEVAPLLLHQPGSHFREVCIAGAMRALEKDREVVLAEDLLVAHELILNGRAVAAQSDRFIPPSGRRRGGFFGRPTN